VARVQVQGKREGSIQALPSCFFCRGTGDVTTGDEVGATTPPANNNCAAAAEADRNYTVCGDVCCISQVELDVGF